MWLYLNLTLLFCVCNSMSMTESNKNLEGASTEKASNPEQDLPETKESPEQESDGIKLEENKTTEQIVDEEQIEQDINPEQEKKRRQGVIDALTNYGVDKKRVETFEKMSRGMDFPQFVDHAIGLFPELGELLIELKQIEGGDLPEIDKNNEKARTASEKFNILAEKMGLSLTEGEKALAKLAFQALATGGEELAQWFKKGWENSDLARLIDAVVMAADYNSPTSLRNLESKEDTSIVSTSDFFKYFKNDSGAITELLKIDSELGGKLNWKGSSKILLTAKNKNHTEQKKALREYLLKIHEAISSSPAKNLVWQQTNLLIAEKIFKKNMLSSDVLTDLEKMHDSNLTLDSF